jgi:hypothetical protein
VAAGGNIMEIVNDVLLQLKNVRNNKSFPGTLEVTNAPEKPEHVPPH